MFVGALVVLTCVILQPWTTSGYNLAVVTSRFGSRAEVDLAQLDTDGQEIIGIARLFNLIYVVCVMNDSIFVFEDTSPYTRVSILKVPALSGMGPGDMVADCDKARLYIIDWRPAAEGNTRVWSVDPYRLTADYLLNATHWTGTLSIATSFWGGKQLIGVSGNNFINVYNFGTGQISHLPLPNNTAAPQHAVRTWSGNFYVSFGWTSGQPHRVLLVDSTGSRILRKYGDSQPGNATGQLNWPRYLAVGTSGGVDIADYWNRQVLELNSFMTRATVVLSAGSTDGVGWPQRLMYDPGRCCGSGSPTTTLFVGMAEKPLSW